MLNPSLSPTHSPRLHLPHTSPLAQLSKVSARSNKLPLDNMTIETHITTMHEPNEAEAVSRCFSAVQFEAAPSEYNTNNTSSLESQSLKVSKSQSWYQLYCFSPNLGTTTFYDLER